MKAPAVVAVILLAVIGFAIGWATAYDSGKDAADGAVQCDEGDVLTIRSVLSDSGDERTLERTLSIGDCTSFTDAAFAAALAALSAAPSSELLACTPPSSATGAPPTPAACP